MERINTLLALKGFPGYAPILSEQVPHVRRPVKIPVPGAYALQRVDTLWPSRGV